MSQASLQLILGARDGDIVTVRRILTDGRVDVNVTDEYGRSSLYRASCDGHLYVVKTLIEAGASVNQANQDGRSPLLTASINGHLDVVKALIESGANVNQCDKMNGTPLFVASVKGHYGVVQSLLEAGANVNVTTFNDIQSPLLMASMNGHLDIVKALIEAGSNVNLGDKFNANPLFVASEKGHHGVVQCLLEAGADMDAATFDDGWSALLTASFNGHLEVVKTLIQAGADVDQGDKAGRSPLYSASFNGHLAVIKTLLEAGASVNQIAKNGWSSLMASTFKGHLDIVKTLIEAGSDVHQANKDQKTAMIIAVEKGHKEIIEVLKISSKVLPPKVQSAEERAARAEQELLETKRKNDLLEQQIKQLVQQADERCRSTEERAARAEQELLETKRKNDLLEQQIKQLVQQAADERVRSTEEREQERLETIQKSETFKQQVKQIVQRADERARSAEERAAKAEQELRIPRQQSLAQDRCQGSQEISPNSMNTLWKIQGDEIEMIDEKPLGKGAWGEVRVAMFRGIKVAAKSIHEEITSPHTNDLFTREMNIAACVRHPNLLLFLGAVLDKNKYVILTELMPANLRSLIADLARDHVISIGTDVASGLNYLHLMRPDPIIHRDVSSANVLVERISTESGSYYRAKVSDYGSANFLSKVTTKGPGSIIYGAPELCDPKLQSPKMDVYSYGILLLEMATGLFPDHNLQAVLLDTLPWQEMAAMIRRCIRPKISDRSAMKDILFELPKMK